MDYIQTKNFSIDGMHCVNCQNKIEQTLLQTEGIKKAKVSFNKGLAEVTFDTAKASEKKIVSLIEDLGYTAIEKADGNSNLSFVSLKKNITIIIIIVLLYILLQQFGILNLLVPSQLADSKMSYSMLFVIGLITSVHCIAMCGGINLSQCIPQEKEIIESKNKFATLKPALMYNLGRIISYTFMGFILGTIGLIFGSNSEVGISAFVQGLLKILAGAFMIIMGINMLGIFPWLRKLNPRLPKFLARRLNLKKAKSKRPFLVGILNGFMPCGPLQSMWIVALAAGNPLSGALSMLFFSLGTVPLMLGFGSIVTVLGKKFTDKVMNIGAVLVVVLGLAMLSQGGSLSGLLLPNLLLYLLITISIIGIILSIPFKMKLYKRITQNLSVTIGIISIMVWNVYGADFNKSTDDLTSKVKTIDGIQVVSNTLAPGKYASFTVQSGIPVKWVIDAPEGSINGCNYSILIQEYGIQYDFQRGENVIEFTPEKAGNFDYSCWMGMIRGVITVTE